MFIIIRKNKESEYIIHTSVCIMYQLCHFINPKHEKCLNLNNESKTSDKMFNTTAHKPAKETR